ncbi:MAG: phosphoribosyltransferase family protein [Candidatus Saccharibacteria bacterium]|nr:phosphoribosyltransferase family protein [Candidatus Saccharibacteria bacterium]
MLKHVWIRTDYTPLARHLTHKLKFERTVAAAEVISGLMIEALPYISKDVLVTHVPTATSRRRQRGYDQAELLARSLANSCGLRHKTLLARKGHSRQVGSDKTTRVEQLQGAFRPVSVIKSPVLLVDDITTTGATLEAAARELKQAGTKKVYATAFAQKQ